MQAKAILCFITQRLRALNRKTLPTPTALFSFPPPGRHCVSSPSGRHCASPLRAVTASEAKQSSEATHRHATVKLSPHPQAPFSFGLLYLNAALSPCF